MAAPPENGSEFPAFPFPPYDIQLQLMRAVYGVLESGGVGIVESPTGTGKTLSLLCSTLTWLEHKAEERLKCVADTSAGESDEPEWMREAAVADALKKAQGKAQASKERRERIRASAMRKTQNTFGASKAPATTSAPPPAVADAPPPDADADFLLDDPDAAGPSGAGGKGRGAPRRSAPISDSDSGSDSHARKKEEEEDEREPIQAVGELRRTRFAETIRVVTLGSRQQLCINDKVKALSSASQMNERCLELQEAKPSKRRAVSTKDAAATAGGGKAPSGRKSSSGGGGGCEFYKGKRKGVLQLKEVILDEPLEVEEVVREGRLRGACPYYASRAAVAAAHVVFAPYTALLHTETREALGLRLEGNVVIVDEAHNLAEAVASTYSAVLTERQLAGALFALQAYLDRFRPQLAAANLRQLALLESLAKAFMKALTTKPKTASATGPTTAADASAATAARGGPAGPSGRDATGAPAGTGVDVLGLNAFLFSTGTDNVDLFRVCGYAREGKVMVKVGGFADAQAARDAAAAAGTGGAGAGGGGAGRVDPRCSARGGQAEDEAGAGGEEEGAAGAPAHRASHTACLQALVSFLGALTSKDADGRVLVARTPTVDKKGLVVEPRLKFLLLTPASRFREVVDRVRAVVLAGGTLSPVDQLADTLFPSVDPDRIRTFGCGHIVPKEHLLAMAVGVGPSGRALDFSFGARDSPESMDEIGRIVINVCKVVPQGVVVFFPSGAFAEAVSARWAASGALAAISAVKTVFREPKTAAGVEGVLERYAAAALRPGAGRGAGGKGGGGVGALTGAVLLCVVGGKLSEGINFNDGLGRCVVLVGLPYANPTDPELAEHMRYLDGVQRGRGRAQYEAMCMRAVNQSIGRAIRHRADYAAVVLADARWTRTGAAAEEAAGGSSPGPGRRHGC